MIGKFLPAVREYIAGLLAGEDGVDDLAQETGLFLWQKRTDFVPGTNFRAWALRIAWFKVMALRRDRAREGRVFFSDAMMERLAARAEERLDTSGQRLDSLRHCIARMRPQDRRLLEWKYGRGAALTELAARTGSTAAALHKTISRLRLVLRQCVEKHLPPSD